MERGGVKLPPLQMLSFSACPHHFTCVSVKVQINKRSSGFTRIVSIEIVVLPSGKDGFLSDFRYSTRSGFHYELGQVLVTEVRGAKHGFSQKAQGFRPCRNAHSRQQEAPLKICWTGSTVLLNPECQEFCRYAVCARGVKQRSMIMVRY